MNTYTVLTLLPTDGSCKRDCTSLETISAATPVMAARKMRKALAGHEHDENEFETLAVFEGEVGDLYEPSIDSEDYEHEFGENENVLEGMRCPRCGRSQPFYIDARATYRVYDSGSEESAGHLEWNEDSYCACHGCGFSGTVMDFMIDTTEDTNDEVETSETCE